MQSIFAKPLISTVIVAAALVSCHKEIDPKINGTISDAAQISNPDPTLPSSYPFQYQGLLSLSAARGDLSTAACGDFIFFGGGRSFPGNGITVFHSTVDIFNVNGLTRTTSQLSQPRYWVSAGSIGNKVFFAGGMSTAGHSNRIDIYDIRTKTWTIANLSQPRYLIAVTSTKARIYFAGGITYNSQKSNVVDIYDANTNSWSSTTINAIEGVMTGASAGATTIFAGEGHNGNSTVTKAVIFNPDPLLQSVMPLAAHNSYYLSSASVGSKVMFAGGYNYPLSKKVSIYDVQSTSWSTHDLSQARLGIGTCRADRFAVFAGGSLADAGISDRLDAYDNNNSKWYSVKLKYKWWPLYVAGAGKTVLMSSGSQVMVYAISDPPPTKSPIIP